MGIKWWFRKRITFEHDPNVESIGRPGRSQQNISIATTGIYRASKDVDTFEVSERPKSLPRKFLKRIFFLTDMTTMSNQTTL